jgi:hypothetical protein
LSGSFLVQFNVQVLDDDGDPVVGKKVTVIFTSFFRGWLEEFTDDDGQAEFDYDSVEPGKANIYVDDVKYGPYQLDDGDEYTVEI